MSVMANSWGQNGRNVDWFIFLVRFFCTKSRVCEPTCPGAVKQRDEQHEQPHLARRVPSTHHIAFEAALYLDVPVIPLVGPGSSAGHLPSDGTLRQTWCHALNPCVAVSPRWKLNARAHRGWFNWRWERRRSSCGPEFTKEGRGKDSSWRGKS